MAVTVATLLDSETIDLLTAAGAASDTDTFPTGQGSNVLTRQTLAALWAWVQGHLPSYKLPVLEVTANLTVDATYNGKILVVTSAGVVISPNYALMGAGFACEIVTSGVRHRDLGRRRYRDQRRDRPAGRSLRQIHGVHVQCGQRGARERRNRLRRRCRAAWRDKRPCAPARSLRRRWRSPGPRHRAEERSAITRSQYRVTGGGAWTAAPGTSVTSTTLTGLTSSTQYDVQVAAGNSAGLSA